MSTTASSRANSLTYGWNVLAKCTRTFSQAQAPLDASPFVDAVLELPLLRNDVVAAAAVYDDVF